MWKCRHWECWGGVSGYMRGRGNDGRDEENHAEPEPGLGVEQTLAYLLPFPSLGLCARVVRPKTLDNQDLFFKGEEPSCRG